MPYHPFAAVQAAPPDPILGLNEQFRADTADRKVNLTSGVYQDETGVNPVLKSVKQAERMWLEQERTKDYLGMAGDAKFGKLVQELMFGADHPVIAQGRAATLHAPGGTGALRVGADFLHFQFPGATVWMSDPTWANHTGIFRDAGLKTATYPYYDAATNGLKFEEMLAALEKVPEGDVVLLHACCHNPSGVDPSPEQWDRIVELFQRRPIMPFLDFAYQGFGQGLEPDAYAARSFAKGGVDLLISSSFSKNLGVYRERVGALTLVTADQAEADRVMSRVKLLVRTNYSNPPSHGGNVAALVLSTPELRKLWEQEVRDMCDRIQQMRQLFVETLKKYGVEKDFSFLLQQKGMFSFSGIAKEDVKTLREKYHIYMLDSGRINVAAMTPSTMDYLCQSIAEVLKGH